MNTISSPGWSLWWAFELKTVFQVIVEWNTDNITTKSYVEGIKLKELF